MQQKIALFTLCMFISAVSSVIVGDFGIAGIFIGLFLFSLYGLFLQENK